MNTNETPLLLLPLRACGATGRSGRRSSPRFSLAGHSMGARVALEIMRQAPQRVVRLALLDTAPSGKAGEALTAALRRWFEQQT